MILSRTFFVSSSGLFDFDLTFPTQALLFLILSFAVTFFFISPISKQLDARAQFINYNLRKSTILLAFGYEKLSKCVGLLAEEIDEMNRQVKLVKDYTNHQFDSEVELIQQENLDILNELKGDLTIKSAFIFETVTKDLDTRTESFFSQRFQSD